MESCETCRYQVKQTCRRYPPTPVKPYNTGVWPFIYFTDFCGEYKQKVIPTKGQSKK